MSLLLLYAVFLASGASSLICEITWARMLVVLLGNTLTASSVILAAFMGGLVLGSYTGGRILSRFPASLIPYALLELGIGLYAVASPAFFDPASALFTGLVRDLTAPGSIMLARLSLAFAWLFFPAFLMGATFPAIVIGSARLPVAGLRQADLPAAGPAGLAQERHAARTGYLYGINTLGGAAGSLLAGYVLLPKIGASLTLLVACLVSFLAVAGALTLHRLSRNRSFGAAPLSEATGDFSVSRPVAGLIMLITFVIGFASLAYEVLLTRLVILYFGNTLVVFTLVVTAFLIGIGLSALLGTWAGTVVKNPTLMAGVTVLAGAGLALPPFLLVALSSGGSMRASSPDLLIMAIMLAPAFMLGSLLPIAIQVMRAGPGRVTLARQAGALYAVNTLGGMLAAGLTNPVLIPLLGVEGTVVGLSALCVLAGSGLWWSQRPVGLRWVAAPACALALILALPMSADRLSDLYARKLAAYSGHDLDATVKLYHEGAVATVIVLDFPWLGFRDMFLNGVEEASTRFGHVQLFKLLGLLPVLAHESDAPKDALMIAFGAGIAAGTTLGSGSVSSLECVDLNPDIAPINDLFKDVNQDVLRDPRFHFIQEDGRNYLLRRSKQYPLIISDSTHPRAYDSWILYTEEFYRLVRRRLTPDGVFAQWLPLSDISVEQYRILLNTFRTVFPNLTLWNVYGTDQAFLLATPSPFVFDAERLQRQLDRVGEAAHLTQYQLDRAVKLAGFFVMDREKIDAFIGDEDRTNRDDRPFHEKQALGRFTPLRAQSFDRYQADLSASAANAGDADRIAMRDRQVLARAMQRLFFFKDEDALAEAALIDPTDGNVVFHQQVTPARVAMLVDRAKRDARRTSAEAARLRDAIRQSPTRVGAYVDLAEIHLKRHNMPDAERLLTDALKQDPESVPARKALAQIYQVTDRWGEAIRLLESVLNASPDDHAAKLALAELYAQHKENQKALALLQAMGPSAGDDFRYHVTVAGAHFALSQYPEAERELSRALEIYPTNTEARWYLSEVYRKTQRRDAWLEQLERLLAINPYHEASLQRLIGFYKETGRQDKVAPLEATLARARKLSTMQG